MEPSHRTDAMKGRRQASSELVVCMINPEWINEITCYGRNEGTPLALIIHESISFFVPVLVNDWCSISPAVGIQNSLRSSLILYVRSLTPSLEF